MQTIHHARTAAARLVLYLLFAFLSTSPFTIRQGIAQQGRQQPPLMSSGGVGNPQGMPYGTTRAEQQAKLAFPDARDWSTSSRRSAQPPENTQQPYNNTERVNPSPNTYPPQQPSPVNRMQNSASLSPVIQDSGVQTASGGAGQGGQVTFASASQPIDTAPNDTAPIGTPTSGKANGIKLRPKSSDAAGDTSKPRSGFESIVTIGSSLLLVIGLFLGAALVYRKAMNPSGTAGMPKEVVQVLGQTLIGSRQQLMLLRFGPKLVLVSVVQGESRTISEITDPIEVDRIAGICESKQPGSISESFRSILAQGGAQ